MRILLTDPKSLGSIVTYLRRCNCSVEIIGSNAVEATPAPPRAVTSAHQRMQLDAYVRIWMTMHPGVAAAIVDQAGPKPPTEQPTSSLSVDGR
jgi:hypothetical protein